MQKVEGSSPFIRFEKARSGGPSSFRAVPAACRRSRGSRGRPRGSIGAVPPRKLVWSAGPQELLPSVVGRQPTAFAVRSGGVLGGRRRGVRVALVPLEDLRDGKVLGDPRNGWLVWQSVSCRGVVTRLPCDVDVLAHGLRVPRRGDGLVLRAALRELFDALYDERRL